MGEGNGTPLHYSCLENPMGGGAWQAAVHGVAEGQTRLSDFTFTFHFHALEKEMATNSSVLAWRIQGWGSLVGYRLWCCTESDTTEVTQQQHAPNIGIPQYIRQTLTGIKGDINSNTIIVRDLKTPLSSMDRSSKLRINKETQSLNGTLDQMDLIDIFRTFHPNVEYTSSLEHRVHSLGQTSSWATSSLSKFKKLKLY